MVAVVVSSANRCFYCLVAHGQAVRRLSGDPQLGEMLVMNYRVAPLEPRQRSVMYRFTEFIGKWSMTDVFVVAVLLAFLATSGNGLTDARLGPGLYFFAAYGLLTLAGSLLLARAAGDPEPSPAIPRT